MEKEIFEGRYIVYSDGRIWSVKREKFLKPSFNKTTGYSRVNIDRKCYSIHILVAKAFIPNINNLPMVNHKNENKIDNRIENLEWCNNRYNINYSIKSKFPGIWFDKRFNKFHARIYHNGKNLYLGQHNTAEGAYQLRLQYVNTHNL